MTASIEQYIDSIIRSVNMDAIRSRGLKVVLSTMFGVSKTALSTILITARCDVDVIHERRAVPRAQQQDSHRPSVLCGGERL